MPIICEGYDVAVIGAGHAGCEAAAAAARLGCKCALFTLNLDQLANMPCNPCIGGTAKGHIVFEIDALGGLMPKIADEATIQSRMLNRGKGPAVHSLRAQCDRELYHRRMKREIEATDNLYLIQAEVVDIILENGKVAYIKTHLGAMYPVGAVIVSTGTFLGGKVFVGEKVFRSGPDNAPPADALAESLKNIGVPLRRFKTGTPPRIDKRSVDLSGLEVHAGDEPPVPFSRSAATGRSPFPQNLADCHIVYTGAETHRLIRDNIQRSAMYSGNIEGVGARYCPSIEDKIVRFADKPRHQLFVEPMGLDSSELYLQGFSTSMPFELQTDMIRTLPGFENARIMRPAYAIEYDCVDPTALKPSLEFKDIPGLFGAGQFNGTSGYEEAAAQGLMAGINAARSLRDEDPLILGRGTSYIGLMIDDLTTKGCTEPYRMLTSRSEYRLLLRQDNTMSRLGDIGAGAGLLESWRKEDLERYQAQLKDEIKRLKTTTVSPSEELNAILTACGTTPVSTGVKLAELIRRPEVSYASLAPIDTARPELPADVITEAVTEIRYSGYIEQQKTLFARQNKMDEESLEGINYGDITGLRTEARQKLSEYRPATLGQASRMPGVNPADVSILAVYIHLKNQREKRGNT